MNEESPNESQQTEYSYENPISEAPPEVVAKLIAERALQTSEVSELIDTRVGHERVFVIDALEDAVADEAEEIIRKLDCGVRPEELVPYDK